MPVARARYVIVHYHIFKNAGTTIERVLEREFQQRFATVHGGPPESDLDEIDLSSFVELHPEITAVSSHHFRYPKPRCRHTVFFDCCFLRDPIARLVSCYKHFRRSDSNDICSRWARSSSPREFVTRLIEEAPHQVSDVQVNQLANAGAFVRPADEHDLDRAIEVVRDMAFPGLVEMFDESMVVAEYCMRPAFPTLRLEYVSENVSDTAQQGPAKAPEYWEDFWGRRLYERLLRMNRLDMQLVRRMKSEIVRRLDMVPQAAERLADFRERCAHLAVPPVVAVCHSTAVD